MNIQDARMCARYGADILGFVVDYPHAVPWNLDAEHARELIQAVSGPAETCVVTGGSPDKIFRVAAETKPNYIQLHCNETLADTVQLAAELGKTGVKIIKTIFPDTPDPEKTAADFRMAGVYALLLDPRTPGNAKNGGMADIALYTRIKNAVHCPVILAGGITPENAAEMVRQTEAEIIDLMTGIEKCPGVKDESKVSALFQVLQ